MSRQMEELRALRVLGVPPGAPVEDVRNAWRDLAKVWHPDRFGTDERLRAKASDNIQRINVAYEALKEYDPKQHMGVRARVRESVAIMFGMGDVGEPPGAPPVGQPPAANPPAASPPGARPNAAPQPVTGVPHLATDMAPGIRRSMRVLGLGTSHRYGEPRRSNTVAYIIGGLLVVLAVLVAVGIWFSAR